MTCKLAIQVYTSADIAEKLIACVYCNFIVVKNVSQYFEQLEKYIDNVLEKITPQSVLYHQMYDS